MNNIYSDNIKENCIRMTNIYNELKENNKLLIKDLDTQKNNINYNINLYNDISKEIVSFLDLNSNCNVYENKNNIFPFDNNKTNSYHFLKNIDNDSINNNYIIE